MFTVNKPGLKAPSLVVATPYLYHHHYVIMGMVFSTPYWRRRRNSPSVTRSGLFGSGHTFRRGHDVGGGRALGRHRPWPRFPTQDLPAFASFCQLWQALWSSCQLVKARQANRHQRANIRGEFLVLGRCGQVRILSLSQRFLGKFHTCQPILYQLTE